MKGALALLFFTASIALAQNSSIPQTPNATDSKGLRQGLWTYWFDREFQIKQVPEGCKFYRVIEFKDDVPVGETKDYYSTGVLYQSLTLTSFKPYGKTGFRQSTDYTKPWKVYWEDGSENLIAPNRIQADLYYLQGKYEMAKPFAEKALVATDTKLGKNNWRYVYFLNRLGKIHQFLGQYTKAEPFFIEASKIADGLDTNNSEYTNSKLFLAELYLLMGNSTKADQLYQETLKRAEAGKRNITRVSALNGIALVAGQESKFKKAKAAYQQCLAIREEEIGTSNIDNDLDYAILRYDMADACLRLGELAQAESLITKAVSSLSKGWTNQTYEYVAMLQLQATIHLLKGEISKAEPLFQQAVQIFEKIVEKNNPTLAGYYLAIANALFLTKKNDPRIDQYAHLAKDGYTQQIANFFPSLSEFEKEAFYNSIRLSFEGFNTYCLLRKDQNPTLVGDMFDNQITTKALLLNSSSKWKQRIRSSGDKKLFALYTEWESNQGLLARLQRQNTSGNTHKIDSIAQVSNTQEKELSKRSELFATLSEKKKYSWQDVKAKLKPGEVAIEMVRVRKYGITKIFTDSSDSKLPQYKGRGLTDTIHYAALLLTSASTSPELVLLKNGNDLEGKHYKYYSNAIRSQVQDKDSYNQFWKPIADKLNQLVRSKPAGGIKVYFSATGVYNKINLNTLLNPNSNKFVLDEINLSLVTNTKDLLTAKREEAYNNLAYLFGYPNYGVSVNERSKLVQKERANEPVYYALALERGADLSELPGTKVEVENIATLMEKKGWQPEVLMGERALEETLKDCFKPRVLHIATHGYFQPDTVGALNPLLRSGLMLTGAAETLNGKKDDKTEDGILTAYEAMNLNLDNTDLVVLSACETGIGEDTNNGEGVYGLQRAFKVAGAKTIIMSLWKVNDEATQELMTTFYENWLNTQNKQGAFASAQQALKTKYKNPYYWGAFVMVGED